MKTKTKLNAFTLLLFLTISGVSTAIIGTKEKKQLCNAEIGNYYSSIDSTDNGTSLLNKLHNINTNNLKSRVGYSKMPTQFYKTDYDPNNTSNLLSYYSGKSAKYAGNMNREHVWPASRTVGGRGSDPLEDDIHMVRPTLTSENSARGNAFYVEGGDGKGSNNSNGWDPASFNVESYRGDAARIIFYCAIADTQLSLVDVNWEDASNNSMGKLSDLLKWNLVYPVATREENRNEGAQSLQGNRNPFIDHPEYACRIWGDYNTSTKNICAQYGNIELEKISLDVTEATLKFEETLQLKVSATPNNASTLVTWTSSNPDVASVSDSGLITASKDTTGYTLITATSTKDSSIKAYCNVTVIEPTNVDLESISVDDINLSIGAKEKIKIVTNPSYIYPTATYSYVSNNSDIASVDSQGNIVGKAAGKAIITITATQGSIIKTTSINIEVSEKQNAVIELVNVDFSNTYSSTGFTKDEIEFKTSNVMNQSGTIQFKKNAGKVSNAQELDLDSVQLVNVSKGTPVIYGAVSSLGTTTKISANGDGIYDLTGYKYFTITADSSSVTNIEKIIINISKGSSSGETPDPIPEDSVTLDKNSATLFIGDTLTLTATASGEVSWNSSNTEVATIKDGLVTAISVGTSTIKATCGKASAICNITVKEKVIPSSDSIAITFKNSSSDSSSETAASGIKNLITEGSDYIKTVDSATKIYAGKTGLKFGSSKATGQLSFSLTEDFASFKISSINIDSAQYGSDTGKLQLKINNEATSDAFTPGTDFIKNFETATSINKITISTTSKRAYLLKIVFNIEKSEEQYTADSFAQLFLDSIGCDPTGNNKPTLSKSWNELKTIYNSLSDENKSLLINAKYINNGEITPLEETTQVVAEAMAKYDYILAKYGTSEFDAFIVGRNVPKQLNLNRNIDVSNNTTMLIMILCLTSFISIASFYLINRKRKQK